MNGDCDMKFCRGRASVTYEYTGASPRLSAQLCTKHDEQYCEMRASKENLEAFLQGKKIMEMQAGQQKLPEVL